MAWLLTEVRVAVMTLSNEQLYNSLSGVRDTVQRQKAEKYERLRALVVAGADAEQGNSVQAWSDALTALFAAVGR